MPTAGGGVQINCMGEFSNFKDYNIEERESLLFPAVGRTSKHKFLELQMKKGHNHRVRRNKNYQIANYVNKFENSSVLVDFIYRHIVEGIQIPETDQNAHRTL